MEVPITTSPSGLERSVLNSQCRSFEGVQAALFLVSLSHRRLELQIRFCALHFDFAADHRPASVFLQGGLHDLKPVTKDCSDFELPPVVAIMHRIDQIKVGRLNHLACFRNAYYNLQRLSRSVRLARPRL